MTDFMEPVIFVQLSEDERSKGVQFQSTCKLCRESHITQVWLCFLVLSFFSISTCAAFGTETKHLQTCLKNLKHTIEGSDAMLYAPSTDEIKESCTRMSLKCYMLELIMVLNEEEVTDTKANCIFEFNEILRPTSVGCLPCEAYSLKNITIFLDRLNKLLEKMTALDNM